MRRRFISHQGLQESFDYNYYLTIEALEDGLTVVFNKEIEYGIDGVGWKKLRGGLKSPSINKGHTISFRAKLTPTIWTGIGNFTISNACNLIGNIMSLLFYNDAASATSLIGFDYAFCRLFINCTTIKSVSSNFTPATTLTSSCYESMFLGCTSLVNAPELPATALADNCYDSMFQGCTSLNYIKMLATDISAFNCLSHWVNGVSSTGTFVKSKDATWNVVGEDGIPNGWTVETE
jgi:hypothetical protein